MHAMSDMKFYAKLRTMTFRFWHTEEAMPIWPGMIYDAPWERTPCCAHDASSLRVLDAGPACVLASCCACGHSYSFDRDESEERDIVAGTVTGRWAAGQPGVAAISKSAESVEDRVTAFHQKFEAASFAFAIKTIKVAPPPDPTDVDRLQRENDELRCEVEALRERARQLPVERRMAVVLTERGRRADGSQPPFEFGCRDGSAIYATIARGGPGDKYWEMVIWQDGEKVSDCVFARTEQFPEITVVEIVPAESIDQARERARERRDELLAAFRARLQR